MNQPIFLTNEAFNSLLTNLVELEEGIGEIIDVFFREPSKEAEDLKKVLNDYVKWMDNMIKQVAIDEEASNEFPYVVIGSEVSVEDVGSKEKYSYKLVSPLNNKVNSSEVSFLSPMGKAMLLKKVDDVFIVKAPGGNFEYRVKAVKIAEDSGTNSSGNSRRKSGMAEEANLVG